MYLMVEKTTVRQELSLSKLRHQRAQQLNVNIRTLRVLTKLYSKIFQLTKAKTVIYCNEK